MISANLTSAMLGGRGEPDPPAAPARRSPFGAITLGALTQPASLIGGGAFAPSAPAPPSPPPPAAAPEAPMAPNVMLNPAALAALRDRIRPELVRPELIRPELVFPVATPPPKTTTQLARGAVTQLKNAQPAVVNAAINSATSRDVRGDGLMAYLERKTRVGEVLGDLAARWSDTTKIDFAEAFNMPRDQFDAMDALVSLAILGDKDLEAELRAENVAAPTPADLIENRRIVWQSAPAGTPWQPPYLMVVAVEYEDVAQAQDVVQSIVSELVWAKGFRMPKPVADRL